MFKFSPEKLFGNLIEIQIDHHKSYKEMFQLLFYHNVSIIFYRYYSLDLFQKNWANLKTYSERCFMNGFQSKEQRL